MTKTQWEQVILEYQVELVWSDRTVCFDYTDYTLLEEHLLDVLLDSGEFTQAQVEQIAAGTFDEK